VLGGAGFVGSHVAREFLSAGYRVIVIDGLLERTGGRVEHLPASGRDLVFIPEPVESCSTLGEHLRSADVIVDCMGWTAHREALRDPLYDLRLNQESHLHVLRHVEEGSGQALIYLASRGQYGNPEGIVLDESTPMLPLDFQGIHKAAGESYYRIHAALLNLRVAALRLPACFGANAPVQGPDIGLIGGFIRDLLTSGGVTLYAPSRRRNFVYAEDAARVVTRLCDRIEPGFAAFNLAGHMVDMEHLLALLVETIGAGEVEIASMPHEVASMEMGSAAVSEDRLHALIGTIPRTDFRVALEATVQFYRAALA
jgi:nucleoside-diphosphate-sugar epimerase